MCCSPSVLPACSLSARVCLHRTARVRVLRLAASVLVFEQPPNPAGGHSKSAWYPPDGLDGDEYAWESFVLPADTAITEIHWRGCYTNYLSARARRPCSTSPLPSTAPSRSAASRTLAPVGGRLRYYTGNNAGETAAGIAGGVAMYDYAFTLPSPFQATAGTKYWVQIVAHQAHAHVLLAAGLELLARHGR